MRALTLLALLASLCASPSCSCSRLAGEVDDLEFTRCLQADAPSARTLSTPQLTLELRERVAELKPKGELRIAAFTGPVGAALSRTDLAELTQAAPSLVLYLGGLGDTSEVAAANLASLATLHVPVLFLAGGADRLALVESAFDDLEGDARERLIHASALRELRVGKDRFALVAGAPDGRYALDDEACGFMQDDLDDVQEALSDGSFKGRTWLLAWAAPEGFGLTRGYAGAETGSAALAELARALDANGGLFAYPEVLAGLPGRGPKGGALALVVPRLGRTGALRADGGRLPRALSVLVLDTAGLRLAAPGA
jgi:hypothetical protein